MTTHDDLPPSDSLRRALAAAINSHSAENGSDTPDFMLADYLVECLRALDATINRRAAWHGEGAALAAAPAAPAQQSTDCCDTLKAAFDAVGYPYKDQPGKEKVSVSFKRWFDAQTAEPAQPADKRIAAIAADRDYWREQANAAPPPPQPQPLTDDDILRLWSGDTTPNPRPVLGRKKVIAFARAVLAKSQEPTA